MNSVMRRLGILSLSIGIAAMSSGQTNFQNNWSYSIMVGASNMLGDLGGGSRDAQFGPLDTDIRSTRPAIGIGTSLHMNSVSLSSNLIFTRLYGDDAYSQSASRSIRNLSARTDLIELNLVSEIRPFYANKSLRRVYIYGGFGGIFYQPKAEFNSEWVKLRPLGTEGQLLSDNETYSKFSLVVPVGLGYKFPLGSTSTLNLDIGTRYTFTDYLDDVSTQYADNATIAEANEDIAAILADRSGLSYPAGSMRANPSKNDSYFFVMLKFERSIGKNSSSCYFDDVSKKSKRRIVKRQRGMF